MSKKTAFLVTCEHGGNKIPAAYRRYFAGQQKLLASHRGYDAGALTMAKELADDLQARLVYSTVSRLLVDLNRSAAHSALHGDAVRELPRDVRRQIAEAHYAPYRRCVEEFVAFAIVRGKCVVHLSSHSFTPILDGEERNADVGLLYDPTRPLETALCKAWQATLAALAPELRLRRNYPYTGKSDGLTAYLRRKFAADAYLGIELEVNQRFVAAGGPAWRNLRQRVRESLQTMLAAQGYF